MGILNSQRDRLLKMLSNIPEPLDGDVVVMTDAVQDVIMERQRQIIEEGWTPEHDDEHSGGEMAMAAGCYALHTATGSVHRINAGVPLSWPWDKKWWKPKNPRRDLVRAGALIIAEIERLDRECRCRGPIADPNCEVHGIDAPAHDGLNRNG